MRAKLLILAIFILSLITPSFAQTQVYCISNQTAILNISITTIVGNVAVQTNTTEPINCPYGCDNSTGGNNDCRPDPTDSNIFTFVPSFILFGMSIFFFYVGLNYSREGFMLFMFFTISLLGMLVNLWYTAQQATILFQTATANTFVTLYEAMSILIILVIAFFFIEYLYTIFKGFQIRKGENR